MTDSDPTPQERPDPESDEEAVRQETEEARARTQAQIDEARRKGHEDA